MTCNCWILSLAARARGQKRMRNRRLVRQRQAQQAAWTEVLHNVVR